MATQRSCASSTAVRHRPRCGSTTAGRVLGRFEQGRAQPLGRRAPRPRRVIGDAGVGIFGPTGDVELGYTLARDGWRHGYGDRVARACLTAALTHLDVPRIIALVAEENDASIRVARADRHDASGPHRSVWSPTPDVRGDAALDSPRGASSGSRVPRRRRVWHRPGSAGATLASTLSSLPTISRFQTRTGSSSSARTTASGATRLRTSPSSPRSTAKLRNTSRRAFTPPRETARWQAQRDLGETRLAINFVGTAEAHQRRELAPASSRPQRSGDAR